jgi:hypothetical protein
MLNSGLDPSVLSQNQNLLVTEHYLRCIQQVSIANISFGRRGDMKGQARI